MFICCQQELVHRVEGFKHVSWKNDKEIDEIYNFTLSVAELSKQNWCSKGTIDPKSEPDPVADCGEYCDITISNDCNTDGAVLNDTFVLTTGSSLGVQTTSFAERSCNQQNIQNTGIK